MGSYVERNIKDGGCARVADDKEDCRIKHLLPTTITADDKVVLIVEVFKLESLGFLVLPFVL